MSIEITVKLTASPELLQVLQSLITPLNAANTERPKSDPVAKKIPKQEKTLNTEKPDAGTEEDTTENHVTLEDIRNAAKQVSREKFKEVLDSFGYANVSSIESGDRSKVLNAIKEL